MTNDIVKQEDHKQKRRTDALTSIRPPFLLSYSLYRLFISKTSISIVPSFLSFYRKHFIWNKHKNYDD